MISISRFLKILSVVLLSTSATAFATSTTFNYTGTVQTYVVPTGVTSVSVQSWGGQGANPTDVLSTSHTGGKGGFATGNLAVVPGSTLYIYVGGAGLATGVGGWNGGGVPGSSTPGSGCSGGFAGGGGDASDVRQGGMALANRVIVGGGGGGAGRDYCNGTCVPCGCGGSGGPDDQNGNAAFNCGFGYAGAGLNEGGLGALVSTVNAGPDDPGTGPFSTSGTLGVGGTGSSGSYDVAGGGGGGGYYGGGGGGAASSGSGVGGGGGGGGSSYIGGVTAGAIVENVHTGNGEVIITVNCSTPVAGTIVVPSPICTGSTATLTDPSGSTGGIWTSMSTGVATIGSTSGIVTGVTAGTALISYSIVLSCGSAFAFTVITVDQAPSPIVSTPIICAGSPVTFTDPSTGGTWSSSNPGIATAGLTTGLISGVTTGSTIITYTLPSGCYTVTSPIQVLVPPSAISGPTSVCMGYPATYTDAATGGTWSSSSTANATIGSTSGLLTPVAPGPTILTFSNGCGSDVYLSITVNPLPSVITGIMNSCVGLTTTLYDSSAGGTWSTLTPLIATVGSTTGVVTGVAGGNALIQYTLPTTCFIITTVTITPPVAPITGANNVCTGSSTTLTESVPLGTWSISDPTLASIGSGTGVVTGISMGVVHVTYTIGSGCSAILAMTVNPVSPVVGRDSVCVGGTGFLSVIEGGGTWASQYPSVATVAVDSGLVYGVAPGISTMTYTLPTGCSTMVNMTVIQLPPAIVGTVFDVCPNHTITLGDAVGGGIWGSVNNLIATVSSTGVVTGVGSDTVTIYYSIAPGCIVTTPVLVKPLPAPILGTEIMCPGRKDTLTDATPGGGTWSSLTPSLATVTPVTGIVLAQVSATGGIATIDYTSNVTSCDITTTIAIYPAPAPSITYIDGTLYTDTGYVAYQWYDSIMGLIPEATSPNCAALYTEYYYVVVTDSSGCQGISAHYEFNAAGLLVKNKSVAGIRIYPNPSDGIVYIASSVNVRAVITGIDGKKVLDQKNARSLDIGKFASGMYFITLYDDRGQMLTVEKLTKQ